MTLRVFIVEDSEALRAHLAYKLVASADVAVVGVAATESHATNWMKSNPDGWDIALVDLFLREGTGAGVVEYCRNFHPGQAVLVMTNHVKDEELLKDCKQLGAHSVYHKSTELGSLVAYCLLRANQNTAIVHYGNAKTVRP